MAYCVVVDNEKTLAELIKAGGYKIVDPDIESFSDQSEVNDNIVIDLYSTESTKFSTIIAELSLRGLRSATVRELITFGNAFPEIQLKNLVVAFGSVHQNQVGNDDVAFLTHHGHKRDIDRRCLTKCDWGKTWLYAAVRK